MTGQPFVRSVFAQRSPHIAPFLPLMLRAVSSAAAPFAPGAAPFYAPAFLNNRGVIPYPNVASWPAAIYDSGQNKTCITFQSVNIREITVARVVAFDHTLEEWSVIYDVGAWEAVDDAHGQPVLCQDADGYLYCFYGGHGNVTGAEAKWAISQNPNDISAWNHQTDIGTDLTYPKPVLVGSDIHLFMRKTNTVSTSWLLTHRSGTPSGGTLTFSAEAELIDLGADSRVYAGEVHLRDGTDIHIIATRANESDTARKGVYYFIYETDSGDVRNLAGTVTVAAVDLPVDLTTANASFRVFDHGSNRGDIPSLQFDADGNPHIVFLDGNGSDFDVKHMYWTGSALSTPETLAATVDPNTGDGNVQRAILAPGLGALMQVFYPQNEDTAIGGDLVRRVRDADGVWGSPQTIVAKGSKSTASQVPVRDPAHPAMRLVFSEVLQTTDYTSATDLQHYTHGDVGFSAPPAALTYQHLERNNERVICGIDPNTGLIDDLSWNCFGIITRQGGIGTSGGYIVFNGTTQYVEFNDSGLWPITGDFAIEVRKMTFNVVNTTQTFISHYTTASKGWFFQFDGTAPTLRFAISPDGFATLNIVSVSWSPSAMTEYDSVAVQRSGSNVSFWVNGTQVGTDQSNSDSSFDSVSACRVGAVYTTMAAGFLDGKFQECRLTFGEALFS